MRQLKVQDPWAGLAYGSDQELISDLMSRIQILENKLRELEEAVAEFRSEPEPEQQILQEAARVGGS